MQARLEELRALVARLLLREAAAADSVVSAPVSLTMQLSVLGGHSEVRRLRVGFGSLRKALERMDDTFEMVQDGALVRLRPEVQTEEFLRTHSQVDAARMPEVGTLEERMATFREAVVQRLRESEEGSLPLSILGGDEEIRALRRGLGTLKTALKQIGEDVAVVEVGTPPEPVARLVPQMVDEGEPNQGAASEAEDGPGAAPPAEVQGDWDQARCRVVAVRHRASMEKEFVTILHPQKLESLQAPLKAQPRDRRLPAFWVADSGQAPPPPAAEEADDFGVVGSEVEQTPKRELKRAGARMLAHEASAASVSREALLRALEHNEAKGLLCVMRFVDWPHASLSPIAEVMQVLGPSGTLVAESDALLSFYGLEWRPFEKAAEEELRNLFPSSQAVCQKELAAGRADLRHIRAITVDPPTARDLDDAVSVEPGKTPGTFRVGVHVADVTHFIKPGSVFDLEARQRATTVYLVGKVYPMLPRWLSENLCSLLPDGDRLAMSVFFTLDRAGNLIEEDTPTMTRAVIRTQERLSYNDVDLALGCIEGEMPAKITADVHEDLKLLAEITTARRQLRIGSGAVVMQRSHFFFKTNEEGLVEGIEQEPSASVSHHLIEELMVLANHVVASKLVEAGKNAPAQVVNEASLPQPLLRRHPDTEDKIRTKIFEILPEQFHDDAPKEATLPGLLEWCRQHWSPQTHEAICADVLTAFKEAEYIVVEDDEEGPGAEDAEPEEQGHFALALPTYMHFTSPIRRYADILVHRRINNIMGQDTDAPAQALDHEQFLQGLKNVVTNCNAKKRDAQDAHLDSVQLALSGHVRARGGLDAMDAVITRILLPENRDGKEADVGKKQNSKARHKGKVMKEALEFYVPVAQCARSVSFDALNIERVYSAEDASGPKPRSVVVRPKAGGPQVELKALEPLKVRLMSEGAGGQDVEPGATARHWTVRFSWAPPVPKEAPVAASPLDPKGSPPPPPPAPPAPPPAPPPVPPAPPGPE